MNVKIEVTTSRKIKNLEVNVQKALDVVSTEHLRGLTKIVCGDIINEPRISAEQRATLPLLYHPRMGGQMAWAEMAMDVLAPRKKFPQNILARLSVKPTIAQAVFYLVAQHYTQTLSRGVKKGQIEIACRSYVEKQFEKWREKEGGWRVKLLKPFKPFLDRIGKKLAKRYREELSKSKK
jgi:hypothetical protein